MTVTALVSDQYFHFASTMWASIHADPSERQALYSLLDEYFTRDPSISPSPALIPPTSTSSSSPSLSTRASTHVADAALQNTAVTSAAFRKAGLSPGVADAASKFGAAHHTTLAPHVASAAKSGWANRAAVGEAAGVVYLSEAVDGS